MAGEREIVKQIKLGLPVPGAKILERRTKGLSAIRREFLARLACGSGVAADSSLIIRWRGLGELANSRTVADASFELVLRDGGDAISGMFPDHWILCYPEDPDISQKVEAEIDRMCENALRRPPR